MPQDAVLGAVQPTKNHRTPRDLYARAALEQSPQLPGASALKGMFSGIKQVSRVQLAEVLISLTLRWRAGSRSGKLPLSKLTEDNQSPLPE
jgi:hypothetical protein